MASTTCRHHPVLQLQQSLLALSLLTLRTDLIVQGVSLPSFPLQGREDCPVEDIVRDDDARMPELPHKRKEFTT
eukprot:11168368-Lingulodinium_polyedra.AAC.1